MTRLPAYLAKIVNKQAYDKSGLVYGMGHAVYTLSDPRAVICKRFAEKLAIGHGNSKPNSVCSRRSSAWHPR